MSGRLDGKVAIITGAATGIGEAVAHKFVREGARVVVNGLPDDPVDEVVDAIRRQGGDVAAFAGDVTDEVTAASCVSFARERFGRLDILINNAGTITASGELDQWPVEDFDRIVRTNTRSAFLMTRAALPALREARGNIVFTGSEAGFNGVPLMAPYGGTKGFLHAFMMGVAAEQARHGVRANCICPGPIDTAWIHKELAPISAEGERELIQATPLGRRGTPEEVANAFAFLASDEASFVTGALWLVDGGITIGKGPVGDAVPEKLRSQPSGNLTLRHGLDGLRGKGAHAIP